MLSLTCATWCDLLYRHSHRFPHGGRLPVVVVNVLAGGFDQLDSQRHIHRHGERAN